ncbi:hypothetical protein [Limnoglobus roseus]|uniref:Glycosyl hydrolase n=1 Tax=Limnoglobus roseus TaxID=2598579 RepID=A0A5C1AI37_9BACT|nr:hypothetical protein [Limnoglobus roseus]QEL17923.1 hypothetical protein PX52LOC_04935 [Limnoglobus roseus]
MNRFLLAVLLATASTASADDGVFVGVGYGGRRIVSTDGKAWSITAEWAEKGGDDSDNLLSVVFAQGKFVAVGGGTPKRDKAVGGHILTSKDGREWKEVHTAKFRVHPVLYGNDRFVAGGPNRNFLHSADGETWKDGAKLTEGKASHFRHGAFGNGVFVFIGNAGGNSPTTWVAVTKDGEKLDHIAIDLPVVRDLTFANGRFVAVGPDGLRMTSADGVKWEHTVKQDGLELNSVVWTGEQFLASGGKTPFTSKDGVTWAAHPKAIPCHVLSVEKGAFVGTSWPGQMWHSADGLDWKKCATTTPNGINKVVYGVPGTVRK